MRDDRGDVYIAWQEAGGPDTLSFGFSAAAEGALEVRTIKTTVDSPQTESLAFSKGENTIVIPLSTRVRFIRVPDAAGVVPDGALGFE